MNFYVQRSSQKSLKKEYLKTFLDKKKIGKYPRLINLKKIGVSNISEMKNNIKIKKTIDQVIFDEG